VLGFASPRAEPQRGRPEPAPSESERIQAPARADVQDDERRQVHAVPLEPRTVPADLPHHRSETLTDVGRIQAPRLNDLEVLKLEMARAAVEASRAAGTLDARPVPDDLDPATPEEVEAIKLQHLEALEPQLIESDPAAGIGEFEPIQETGPPGLTEYETRKLNGENPDPVRADEIVVEPSQRIAGDGSPAAPVREEVQPDE
jgi:hypothetical protein